MIPFFRSLAALVRRLLAEGRAVHCTEEDARELELLARLLEYHGPVSCRKPSWPTGEVREWPVSPSDFALAWLKLSRITPDYPDSGGAPFDDGLHEVGGDRIKRSAVCAELAVLAARLMPEVRVIEPELSEERKAEYRKMLADFGCGVAEIKPLHVEPVGIDPHDGTPEGARAVWQFVVDYVELALKTNLLSGQEWTALLDKYRRELEALQ